MTPDEVRRIVEAEIGNAWGLPYDEHLKRYLVTPRKVKCRNTFPKLKKGKPIEMWIVFEEPSNAPTGYVVVFDEKQRAFGLAVWDANIPVLLGYYGTFLNTLEGM